MDNNKEQEMQNWKKLLILDPILNNLFTPNIDVKDFLHQKILTQDHQQIVSIYSRLSTVRHALSKNIQKEVETKYQSIEKSFMSKHQIQNKMKLQNVAEVQQLSKSLKGFNQGYESVRDNLVKLENINRIIRFSKALEKFKINIRLLRTFMKDHIGVGQLQSQSPTGRGSQTVSSQSVNLLKVSKLLRQIQQLTSKNDFSQIRYYQQEKVFINSARETLYTLTEKQLNRTLEKYREGIRSEILGNGLQSEKMGEYVKDVREKLLILQSINKLRQYIPLMAKPVFVSASEHLKRLFEVSSLEDFSAYMRSEVLPNLLTSSYMFISLQEILTESELSVFLKQSNLPNLFVKYVQNLVSYWGNLINWNMEQDVKEMEKRRAVFNAGKGQGLSIVEYEQRQLLELVSDDGKNITPNGGSSNRPTSTMTKYRLALWLKYPILYDSLGLLVNKMHEQVLLNAKYNIALYQFPQKKSLIMDTLFPLGKRFYHKLNSFVFNKIGQQLSIYKGGQRQVDKVQIVIKRLRWVYERVLGVRQGGIQSNRQDQIYQERTMIEGHFIVELINQKVLGLLQAFINNSTNQEGKLQQQETKDNKKKLIKQILLVISKKQTFISYGSLQLVIQHLKRLNSISKWVDSNL